MNRLWPIMGMGLMVMAAGCSNDPTNENNNENGSTTAPPDFRQARISHLTANTPVILQDEIQQANTVKTFDLGAVQLGDRLEVTCSPGSNSLLDPMLALFDADGFRIFWNDDLDEAADNFNAGFNELIRHDSNPYYLAVTHTDYGPPGADFKTGTFRCELLLTPQDGLATISGHTVVLNWADASGVAVAGTFYGDLPEFSTANIDDVFAGQETEFQQRILQIVRDDYAPFEVTILDSNELPEGDYTTVFYGVSTQEPIYGIADDVDFYNAQTTDNAILFLQAFGGITSDWEETAQAIANVTSHEIGHTLGLMHTTDVTELMDTTGADFTLLVDQSFGIGDLYDFPIGQQSSPLLLDDTVGPRQNARAQQPGTFDDDGYYHCGTCGAKLKVFQKH
ncbi:MAG: hypothetical protein HJJLKODD_00014 [Phycisphaerae bacterium]|nr:hypothetical protein [Phycisphaerae bacterium]